MSDAKPALLHGIDAGRVGAVVFDLGGVFLAGTVDNVIAFGESVGLTAPVWQALRQELFIEEGAWNRVERGEMTLDAFAEILIESLAGHGIALDLERARNFMGNTADTFMMRLRPEIVEACRAVRRRVPTALLTNNIAEWREGWRSRLAVAELFDAVIDSHEVGMRKPEPGIYALTEERLGIAPARLLFIDDLGVNLKPARQRGWQTLKYEETADVLDVLNAIADGGRP